MRAPCVGSSRSLRLRQRRRTMLAAAIKALSQMLSPPFRSVLLKSVGLALALMALLGIALQHLFVWLATAFVLGRGYFELVAMRHHSVAAAKRLRKEHHGTVLIAGLFVAAFVSIPIVNLATPLFGTAMMVHVYRRIATSRK